MVGAGLGAALRQVDQLLRRGYIWVVDVDLKSYFDTIPHDRLMALVRGKVADSRVLHLVESFLGQQVDDEGRRWSPTSGTPQGGVISALLSNIYLDPLDHEMARVGFRMIRYADDQVVMCRSEEEAQRAMHAIREWTRQAGLTLNSSKTRIVHMHDGDGFEFLGYHLRHDKRTPNAIFRWPRKTSLQKFKDRVRTITKRNNGHSLATIIARLNPQIRGFFEYFKQSNRMLFGSLDGWIRMRLRSILRRRKHRRGRGRGADHQLWPNSFFGERGLFFMAKAWRERGYRGRDSP